MTTGQAMKYIRARFAFLARCASSGSFALSLVISALRVLRPTDQGYHCHSYNRTILPSSGYCLSTYLLSRWSWYAIFNNKTSATTPNTSTVNVSISMVKKLFYGTVSQHMSKKYPWTNNKTYRKNYSSLTGNPKNHHLMLAYDQSKKCQINQTTKITPPNDTSKAITASTLAVL
jgi:hypothetical protein